MSVLDLFALWKTLFRRCPLLALLIVLCLPVVAARAQDEVKEAPSLRLAGETYRLRVQNVELGRVEASADGGVHYFLIGRVQRPATATVTEKAQGDPGVVLRSGGEGLAFTVGANRVVKLRPEPGKATGRGAKSFRLPAAAIPSEIATNLPSGSGLFGELTPQPGTQIRLQANPQTLASIADDHTLSSNDVFVFIVSLPARNGSSSADTQPDDVSDRIAALAHAYAVGAVARARASGYTVVSGILKLNAKLPEGEPDPIAAVTYSVDDDLIAAQNVGPYSFDWDTRRASDGEHVVEISALNRNGRLITHARALIVVDNGGHTGSTK